MPFKWCGRRQVKEGGGSGVGAHVAEGEGRRRGAWRGSRVAGTGTWPTGVGGQCAWCDVEKGWVGSLTHGPGATITGGAVKTN
jgi:hypothetical protein